MSAVKRYTLEYTKELADADGDWVEFSDYLALKAALREALDGWEESETWMGRHADDKSWPRIAALRAQFLDDK